MGKRRNLSRLLTSFLGVLLMLMQFGCFRIEDTKPPSGTVYYTGPMIEKPKNSMTPKGRAGNGGER
jgi:hypothetical protein